MLCLHLLFNWKIEKYFTKATKITLNQWFCLFCWRSRQKVYVQSECEEGTDSALFLTVAVVVVLFTVAIELQTFPVESSSCFPERGTEPLPAALTALNSGSTMFKALSSSNCTGDTVR